ncbi:MAG: hypothetical protein JJT75_06060 [Opitutales bacterium]|nr:hypothetical protein [Opitutales bacterium]
MIRVNLNFNFRGLSALFCIFLSGCLASEEQRRLEVTREYYEHLVYNTSSGSFLRESNKNTLEHLQEIEVQDLERPFLLEVSSAGWNPLAEKKVAIDILWSKGWYAENHLEFNIVDWDKSFVSENYVSWPEAIEMGTMGGPVEDFIVYEETHAIPKKSMIYL